MFRVILENPDCFLPKDDTPNPIKTAVPGVKISCCPLKLPSWIPFGNP